MTARRYEQSPLAWLAEPFSRAVHDAEKRFTGIGLIDRNDHDSHQGRGRLGFGVVRDTALGYAWLARTAMRGFGQRASSPVRHLLLLAWEFPPRISGGVYRPAAIARYAIRRGWKVSVISGTESYAADDAGRYMLDYIGPNVRILRVPPGFLKPSYTAFPRVDGGFLNALQTVDLAMGSLASDPPGVILASGPPFHNFMAARYISRATGVPYVLDYRDEWTECPFGFVHKGNADRHYERACIRGAAGVIFTTESHLSHQAAVFPRLNEKCCVVIPNGWEPLDVHSTSEATPDLPAAQLRVAFVGTLGDHTLPASFLATLSQLLDQSPKLRSRLRLTFVGQKRERARQMLLAFPYPDCLDLIDEVPKPAALQVIRTADAVLVINERPLHRYLPGKLYDYLATETPILVYGTGGEVSDLVLRFAAGRVVPAESPTELAQALASIKEMRGISGQHGVREWLAQHTRERMAERVIDLLNGFIGRGGNVEASDL